MRPLIITDETDGSAALVIENLRSRGFDPFVFECERLSLPGVSLTITADEHGESAVLNDELRSDNIVIQEGARVLRRRPSLPQVSAYGYHEHAVSAFVNDQYRSAVNSLFTLDVEWMNRASADRHIDQNKLLGLRWAKDVGLEIIPTVLTDDPKVWLQWVAEFARQGDLAVKPTGGWAARIIGSESIASIFTKRLSEQEARDVADSVKHAPVLLQPYVDKLFELRITMVNGTAFACRIDSQASARTSVDWRHYDLENTPHSIFKLDDGLTSRLQAFMTKAGLLFAGIDMIVTTDNRYLFVEANPAGQFGWIEELTGLQISSAIANWLVGIEA